MDADLFRDLRLAEECSTPDVIIMKILFRNSEKLQNKHLILNWYMHHVRSWRRQPASSSVRHFYVCANSQTIARHQVYEMFCFSIEKKQRISFRVEMLIYSGGSRKRGTTIEWYILLRNTCSNLQWNLQENQSISPHRRAMCRVSNEYINELREQLFQSLLEEYWRRYCKRRWGHQQRTGNKAPNKSSSYIVPAGIQKT